MRILLLADIHIGSIPDVNYVYGVLTSIVDKELQDKKTDAVVILGDYFDRLFKANEEYVALAVNFMSYLVRVCQKNKIKIRLIYGTESHEMNQYRLFNHHFTDREVDIKLFTTVTEEELLPEVNVLYVPEEFIGDKHEFYKDTIYSNKHYDFIFGHGTVVEGMPNREVFLKEEETKSTQMKVPRFNMTDLGSRADLVVFGHVHIPYDDKNFHYLGSLFRDKFGEESPKRYAVIEDKKIKFIENTKAYTYDTFTYEEDSDIYESAESIIKHLNEIKSIYQDLFSGDAPGKIRLVFHPPVDVDPGFFTMLKDIIFNDKVFKTMIKEVDHTAVAEEDAVEDEYAFVLDRTLKPEDKIYTLIGMNHEDHMTMQELIDYMYNPLKI